MKYRIRQVSSNGDYVVEEKRMILPGWKICFYKGSLESAKKKLANIRQRLALNWNKAPLYECEFGIDGVLVKEKEYNS